MADTKAPPEPSVYAPPAPAAAPPAVTIGWAAAPSQAKAPAVPKAPKRRALPAGPVLAAAGNAAALGLTSAYDAAGWAGFAGAAGAVAAGTVTAAARRRRTVKVRNASVRAGRTGSPRSGSGAGSGRGFGGTGSTAGSPRAGSGTPRTSGTGSGRSGDGGTKGRNPGAGSGGTSPLARTADRLRGGNGKVGGADKASRRSASEDAAEAKTIKAARKAAKAAAKKARKPSGLPSRSRRFASASKRGAGRLWSKTGSPRAAARRLTAKGLRKTRGLTVDGLRSLRTGVWGLIRHLSWKKGAKRALAAWTAHRAKRNTPVATVPAPPTIASTVRRPVSTTPTRSPGGSRMSGYHFVAPAMDGARAAANYNPTGMLQVIEDFAGLSEALELHAQAMRVTVENADAKFPLAPQVVDLMRQVHNLQLKAAELARELQPASRKLHEADLARHTSPRKGPAGERMWDLSSNS